MQIVCALKDDLDRSFICQDKNLIFGSFYNNFCQ